MTLIEELRERHWEKILEVLDDGHWLTARICNQDGQQWPCYTEQVIRRHE